MARLKKNLDHLATSARVNIGAVTPQSRCFAKSSIGILGSPVGCC